MYHTRINGDMLAFGWQLRASVSASLCGDLPDHSWWQATTGVTCGGLGLRTTLGVALPAVVASLVSTTIDHLRLAFGTTSQPIMAEYDARADDALARLVSTLPTIAAQVLVALLDEALAERELLWRNVLSGTEDAMQDLPSPSLSPRHHSRRWGWRQRPSPGTQELEGPGPCHRLRGHGRPPGPATDARERGLLGRPRGFLNSASRRSSTPGCGASTRIMAPCWSPKSTLILFAYAWAAPGPVYLVLPVRLDPWTQAPPTPLAAPWARPPAATTRSSHLFTLLPSLATTPPRLTSLASSLAPIFRPALHLVHCPRHLDLLSTRPASRT